MRMIAGLVLMTMLATPAGNVSETLTVVKTDNGYAITVKLVEKVPEGVVSGDTFSGTVDLGGFAQAPYTGVRIKQRN
jgi:hypothetical protein